MIDRLEADLLDAGQRVVRVHARMMAGMRRSAREAGKSDPIDAEAVARVALREDDLTTAELPGPMREITLLSDHRRTRSHAAPRCSPRSAGSSTRSALTRTFPPGLARLAAAERAAELPAGTRACRGRPRPARGIAGLTRRINTLERRLDELVRATHPTLLEFPGMGVLGAAMILGETADARRFRSRHAYARFNGTAPTRVWSGNEVKVRLSRGGNRTIDTALHMTAVTQLRLGGEGAVY